MELHDPVAVYTAASNLDAHQIAGVLLASGVESQVVEDNSTVGIWVGGINPLLTKPQIWVSSRDLERAAPVIQQFENLVSQRFLTQGVPVELRSEWIDATCEKCGTVTRYAPIQKGTVENCPNCLAFIDVGVDDEFDDWNVIDVEADPDESEESDSAEAPE